jgi:hypothetical protein
MARGASACQHRAHHDRRRRTGLTLAFTLFTIWRLYRRRVDHAAEAREDFLAYPQTSPEIYAWLPYHREPARDETASDAPASDAPVPDAHEAKKFPL